MDIELRDATEADVDTMLDIYRAVCARGDTLPSSGEEPREDLRAEWMEGDRASVVAVSDGMVVGMYKWGANRTHRGAHIGTATFVVVRPPARGLTLPQDGEQAACRRLRRPISQREDVCPHCSWTRLSAHGGAATGTCRPASERSSSGCWNKSSPT